MVSEQIQPVSREALYFQEQQASIYRCQSQGWGGGSILADVPVQGHWPATESCLSFNKHSGIESHLSCTISLPSAEFRQHISQIIYQHTGRIEIPQTSQRSSETPEMGRDTCSISASRGLLRGL